jgi:hypothetical protein
MENTVIHMSIPATVTGQIIPRMIAAMIPIVMRVNERAVIIQNCGMLINSPIRTVTAIGEGRSNGLSIMKAAQPHKEHQNSRTIIFLSTVIDFIDYSM